MKGLISMVLIGALALTLAGCHAPADTAAASSPLLTSEPTVPAATEAPPETAPVSIQRPEPEDADFVRVRDYLPDVIQQLPYAGTANFTGQQIYEFTEVFLRYGTVKKLRAVCDELSGQGLSLKIWDGFRPVSAQFKLWEVCPDDTYVANPTRGFSAHSRGNTVDVTLVDTAGNELEMPTGFDDFSGKADRDYSDVAEIPAGHALLLQNTMEKYGFVGYFGEWWHFQDEESYPVEEVFEPVTAGQYYARCNEFISLRTRPDTSAQVIVRIPRDGEFTVLAHCGVFALAQYQGTWGYVHRDYIRAVKPD